MIGPKYSVQRDDVIDILKGIGIVCMIIAHTVGPESFIWDAIYTFHMPLFFITTGFLYKQKNILEIFRYNFSRLLVPYISACIIIVFLSQIRQPHSLLFDLKNILLGLGPGWFLLAIFLTRIEFHFILRIIPKWHILIALLISSSICLLSFPNNWPYYFAFCPSLVGLIFISAGYYVQQRKLLNTKVPLWAYFFTLFFWIITFLYGKIEMSHCLFKLNIFDFIGSIGGTFIIYKLCQIIDTNKIHAIVYLKDLLVFTGRHSLVFLFFHMIDYCLYPWYIIESYISNRILLLSIITMSRFLLVYLCVIISTKNKVLRSFFTIK